MKRNLHKTQHRGTANNLEGRFENETREKFEDGWSCNEQESDLPTLETTLLPENAKSIITRNNSPDIPFEQSINPYRGCEHGCIYCYARPSHAYMNLSPGLDFESKIFYKVNAALLLEKEISKRNYLCKPIILGSNTDPYQPAELKLKTTRSLLEVLYRCHHPLGIITKSSLIRRDIELLADMAKHKLAKVAISVTTLSDDLKKKLEPRASTGYARLKIIEHLSKAGIPVRVMAAPMIPLINDAELEAILQSAHQAGAQYAGYTLLRLPYEVKDLFKEWLIHHFPDRSEHVMHIIRDMRKGKENDSTFGQRMQGTGEFAKLLQMRFHLACKRFHLNTVPTPILDTSQFKRPSPQMEFSW